MLSAIQGFVKGILDGLPSPQLQPMQAVIMPPVDADAASSPIAYIWAGAFSMKRTSAPRPVAWQNIAWRIDIGVISAFEIDDANIETAFPLLLDSIVARTATWTPMPFTLIDPVTGFPTQITSLGEAVTGEYARINTTSSSGQGLIQFGADIRLAVTEKVSFPPGSYYNHPDSTGGG